MEKGDGVVLAANGDQKRKAAAVAAEDGRAGKRRGGWGRGKDLEGRYVWKEFPGMGVFLGKVMRFEQGLYRVCYEDGDAEDLEFREIRRILIAKAADFCSSPPLVVRKEKLDCLAAGTEWNPPSDPVVSPEESSAAVSGMSSDVQSESEVVEEKEEEEEEDEDEDEFVGEVAALPEPSHPALPLPLPPSSGGLGVPEEAVSYLFSVYNFLRSFSNLIFLSPFSLDSFVGSLNCNSRNTLLDAVHVCLLRALGRHLQTLSSDGDELASKCLSHLDWSLLDVLTWPVFLVEYLLIMGRTKGAEWKAFENHVLASEYYSLAVAVKLQVLQILCDDVLDSVEVRAEIDARESEETEIDADGSVDLLSEHGPKRVHPRHTKTSASRDVAIDEICVGSEKTAMTLSNVGQVADEADAANDGNSDECRLCGMDGTLLCCDGCPSAYHSRCIGVSKAHLPNGMWFCPECAINKIHPSCARIGMGVRGAEVFGVDPYDRVFLGTCDYLVVLDLAMSSKPNCRYYSSDNLPKVLLLLYESEYALVYTVICAGILKYWHLSVDQQFSYVQKPSARFGLSNGNGKDAHLVDVSLNSLSTADETTATNNIRKDGPFLEIGFQVVENLTNSKLEIEAKPSNLKYEHGELEGTSNLLCPTKSQGPEEHNEQIATVSFVPQIIPANFSDANLQNSGGKSTVVDFGHKEDVFSWKLQENVGSTNLGTSFKPHAYINQYIHGDAAASAVANLAILTSENGRASEIIASSDSRKITAENISLQAKAFSEVALHFQWPTAERKLLEVPRDKCGWCIGCKAPPNRKMRCLLNSAALSALKHTARGFGSIRILKNEDGIISAIAAYILLMAESLQGLLIGPLSTRAYRNQWRRHLEMMANLSSLKYYLLELEENVRQLAFSTGWVKLVDDLSVDSCTAQYGTSVSGLPQKRGLRRNKKQVVFSEENLDPCPDWWRGNKITKILFHRSSIPSYNSRKAGRQGGFKKIPGVSYAEEIPKRSLQYAWRAAVEMSRNASQLALQVRYLDSQIRWGDIVRPDQVSHEAKGSDIEIVSAFRNAIICGKETMEGKITYALSFANQKHLPSRLMKNVVQTENLEDGKEKKWFNENHVPLYLIKEYEEKAGKDPSALSNEHQHDMSKLQFRQLKAYYLKVDIFSYLMHKVDQPIKNSCISCQTDVFLRHAVKCYWCQGLFHKGCLLPSVANMKGEICSVFVCNRCYHSKSIATNGFVKWKEHVSESIASSGNGKKLLKATSESTTLGQNVKKCLKVKMPVERDNLDIQNLQHVANRTVKQLHPRMPGTTSASTSSKKVKEVNTKYGLIWKQTKVKTNDDPECFRNENILLKCSAHVESLERPICFLCHQPYNPDLIYIRCEICKKWYHADAVHLQESQILELKGFRCCKCRKKISPICPYMESVSTTRKLVIKLGKKHDAIENIKSSPRPFFLGNDDSNGEANDNTYELADEDVFGDDDASLLSSVGIVEPGSEWSNSVDTSGWPLSQSAQKLSVRRHMKDGQDASSSNVKMAYNDAANNDFASLPVAEWGVSGDLINYDAATNVDMEFEPQTYFSYQELLASENDQAWDMFNVDAPTELTYDWSNTVVACPDNHVGVQESDHSFLEGSGLLPCWQCQRTDPAPELSCVKCNLQIHKHCSPWTELPSLHNSGWECGGCRNWM